MKIISLILTICLLLGNVIPGYALAPQREGFARLRAALARVAGLVDTQGIDLIHANFMAAECSFREYDVLFSFLLGADDEKRLLEKIKEQLADDAVFVLYGPRPVDISGWSRFRVGAMWGSTRDDRIIIYINV